MKFYLFIEDLAGKRYGILSDGSINDDLPEEFMCDAPMDALVREIDFRRHYPNTKGIQPYIGACIQTFEGTYEDLR